MSRFLTVLMPTLNAERYLVQALDSLASQTFPDFELLVVDAGSTDGTLDLLRDLRIRTTIISCDRIGLGAQLRLGLEQIKSRYVARMDADDISEPERFEKEISVLEGRPELSIVGSQISLLAQGRLCRAGELPQRHEVIRKSLLDGFPAFSHPTVMFRTEVARRCKAYSIAGSGEDLDFYLRMTEVGRGENLPTVLHRYRLHERSVSFGKFAEIQRNYGYAVACANARHSGSQEPTLSDYTLAWMNSPFNVRLLDRLDRLGTRLYRTSRIRLAEGRPVRGLVGALASLLVRPRLVRTRVMIRWGAWRHAVKLT